MRCMGSFRFVVLVIGMGWCIQSAIAQNQVDVFRLSYDMFVPSARAQGMGGAFGAIGADPSSAFINPAGVGLYKTSVMDLGVQLISRTQQARFNGTDGEQKNTDLDVMLPIDHFTWVRSYPTKNKDWRMFNIALSHGKLAMYQKNFEISANTQGTSRLDAFAVEAQGYNFGELNSIRPFSAGLAWQTYGIDTLPGSTNTYYSNYYGGNVQQSQMVAQDGKKSDFGGVFSANYRDQLYLGMSLSLQSFSFSEKIIHQEKFPDTGEILQLMEYSTELEMQGTSAQWRWGVIWIPERYPWARLGLAYHSGVNFYCTDNYFADMTTQFTGANYQYSSPINELNYYIRTPRKWQLNTAFNVGDRWLLAGDVEQQDFRKGNIEGAGSNTYGYQSENSLIEEQGNLCTRLRLGVEFRAIGPLRLRAGWDYQSAPYAQMQALQQFHAGIGVRAERFFIDASLSLGGQQQTWYMYDSRLVAAAQIHTFQTSGRLSVGWRLSDFHQQEDPQELTPKGSGTGDF